MEHLQSNMFWYRIQLIFVVFSFCFVGNRFSVDADEMEVKIKAGAQNRYIGRQGLVLFDAPIAVSEIVVKDGEWYGGLLNVTALDSDKSLGKFGNEIDFTIGWRKSLGTNWYSPILDFDTSYFVLGDWSSCKDDRYVLDARLDMVKIQYVQPYFAFRYFGSMSEMTRDGYFFWLGLKRDQSLGIKLFSGEISVRADVNLEFATDRSFGRNGGFIYSRFGATLNIPLNRNLSLNPSYMIQAPSGDQKGNKGDYVDGIKHLFGCFLNAKF